MNIKDFASSKTFQKIIWWVGILIVVLFIFQIGVFVGYRDASFSYKLGDNYYRTFGGGPSEDIQNFPPGGHGVSGKIIKISLPTILVASDDGLEKSILVGTSTLMRELRQVIPIADLKVDDMVVIIGSPNSESQIEAKFIRVIPANGTPLTNQ